MSELFSAPTYDNCLIDNLSHHSRAPKPLRLSVRPAASLTLVASGSPTISWLSTPSSSTSDLSLAVSMPDMDGHRIVPLHNITSIPATATPAFVDHRPTDAGLILSKSSHRTAQPPDTGNTCPTKQSAAELHK